MKITLSKTIRITSISIFVFIFLIVSGHFIRYRDIQTLKGIDTKGISNQFLFVLNIDKFNIIKSYEINIDFDIKIEKVNNKNLFFTNSSRTKKQRHYKFTDNFEFIEIKNYKEIKDKNNDLPYHIKKKIKSELNEEYRGFYYDSNSISNKIIGNHIINSSSNKKTEIEKMLRISNSALTPDRKYLIFNTTVKEPIFGVNKLIKYNLIKKKKESEVILVNHNSNVMFEAKSYFFLNNKLIIFAGKRAQLLDHIHVNIPFYWYPIYFIQKTFLF